MRALVAEVKKPNREAFQRVERLIKDVKVLAKGEDADKPGLYGQIAKDIAMIPAEHIAFTSLAPPIPHTTSCTDISRFPPSILSSLDLYDNYVFGTIKTNSRKEFNTPGSLGKAQGKSNPEKRRMRLCERRYKEAKLMRYRKPILRMMKAEAVHSDDEHLAGGDARKNRGLLVHTKESCNPIVTAFVYEQDRKIAKRQERSPTKKREPETRTLANPPTSSALSRILPVGVPIDFWTPKFYNSELDLHEKAMYINTGVLLNGSKPLSQVYTSDGLIICTFANFIATFPGSGFY
ncbi:hypothetical protein B0H13DRAFT_2337991 [Mycena leptocephala]|nr:hypothetical protein B0H13DRAFT_2337991 [Mycena leptocephala]